MSYYSTVFFSLFALLFSIVLIIIVYVFSDRIKTTKWNYLIGKYILSPFGEIRIISKLENKKIILVTIKNDFTVKKVGFIKEFFFIYDTEDKWIDKARNVSTLWKNGDKNIGIEHCFMDTIVKISLEPIHEACL